MLGAAGLSGSAAGPRRRKRMRRVGRKSRSIGSMYSTRPKHSLVVWHCLKNGKNTKLFTLQDKFRKWLMAVGHKSPSHKKEEICLANLKRIVEVNFQIIVVSL